MLLTADNPAVYAEAESMHRKKTGTSVAGSEWLAFILLSKTPPIVEMVPTIAGTSPDRHWVVMTANVSEPKDNGEWTAQIAQFGKQHILTHLLKLLLALECDAWVSCDICPTKNHGLFRALSGFCVSRLVGRR